MKTAKIIWAILIGIAAFGIGFTLPLAYIMAEGIGAPHWLVTMPLIGIGFFVVWSIIKITE